MPVDDIRRLGVQLAGALEVSHAQGIIHRDIKPRNIFLTERGDAKLLDFGLAKAAPQSDSDATGLTLEAEADLTQEQRVVGTPSYMSPEQVLGRPLDGRSDLFSLGGVLYCMATGRRPFQAESVPATLDAVLHRDPAPVASLNPAATSELDRVIRRCLAKNPAARYRSAGQLREDLERLAPSSTQGSRPGWDRSVIRRLAIAAGVALMVLIAAAGLFLLRDGDAPRSRSGPSSPVVAVLPFSNQTGDSTNDYLGSALSAGLATELSEIGALRLLSPNLQWATNRNKAIEEARATGTELFVEGEVGRAGDRLRVQARIIDSGSSLILWSETLDVAGADVLATQSRLARAIAAFLAVPLSPRERSRLESDPTSSLTAWRLYAEGLRAIEEPTASEGVEHAIDLLTDATRVDPEFAPAHSVLARALWSQYEVSKDASVLAAARKAVERAEAIDPELPDTRITRALVFGSVEGDLVSPSLTAALSRHPRPATAHRELALLYERVGRLDEAERLLHRAIDLDPEDWFNWNWLGVFLFRHRDPGAAEQAFERAAELTPPGVDRPRENLAALHAQAGRFNQAIAILEALPSRSVDATVANTLATAYYFSARPDKWEKAEQYYRRAVDLQPHRALLQGNLADLYSARGKVDDATAGYRAAMTLAEDEARANPQDSQAPLLVALYAAKAGECPDALGRARGLDQGESSSSQWLHELALVFSLCRDRDATLDALRRAIESGFPPSFAAQEEEFHWLAEDPSFESVIRLGSAGTPIR
jgi:TolB-like protein/Tfp pilus assembly protein PilF